MPVMTDYDVQDLAADLVAWGFKPSHAPKLMRAFYGEPGGKAIDSFRDGTFGLALEARLRETMSPRRSHVIARRRSEDGTVKLLLALDRGGRIRADAFASPGPGSRVRLIADWLCDGM